VKDLIISNTLSEKLPRAMIPTLLVTVERLPKTSKDKIYRKSLVTVSVTA
tara:strand:+ start:83 stop:232 length:150 start_codon:yes stop_codon:yes gene_type:complete